jgi:hypothetical protein
VSRLPKIKKQVVEFASVDGEKIINRFSINSALSRFLLQLVALAVVATTFAATVFYANKYIMQSVEIEKLPLLERDGSAVRVSPKDPGGIKVEHKDKQIYNTISSQNKRNKSSRAAPKTDVNKLIHKLEKKPVSVFDVTKKDYGTKTKINLATLKSRPDSDKELRRLNKIIPVIFDLYDVNITKADSGLFVIQVSGFSDDDEVQDAIKQLTSKKLLYVVKK